MDPDASTTARVYVIVMGPNDIETERLWLDLPEGKKSFAAGTMENFQCYGTDVREIKRVEVRMKTLLTRLVMLEWKLFITHVGLGLS